MDEIVKRPSLQEYLLNWILTYGVRSDGWGEYGWRQDGDNIPEYFDSPKIYNWQRLFEHGYLWRNVGEDVVKVTAKGKRVAYGKEGVPTDLILWRD